MKKLGHMARMSMVAALVLMSSVVTNAQFYEIANQLPQLISPALSGGASYKGMVELSGTAGIGDSRTNFVGVSTSQGFQYADWFFMGVGIGVDVATSPEPASHISTPSDMLPDGYPYNSTRTKAMLPLFTDFRFNIGDRSHLSCFIDLKIGASWFLGDDYLELGGNRIAYMGNGAQFYLKPQLGMRIPISSGNTKQAINVGLTYQLITSNNNWYWNGNSVTLNSLGLTLGFEW